MSFPECPLACLDAAKSPRGGRDSSSSHVKGLVYVNDCTEKFPRIESANNTNPPIVTATYQLRSLKRINRSIHWISIVDSPFRTIFNDNFGNVTDLRGCLYGHNTAVGKSSYNWYYPSVKNYSLFDKCPDSCLTNALRTRNHTITPTSNNLDNITGCNDIFPDASILIAPNTTEANGNTSKVPKPTKNDESDIGLIAGVSVAGAIILISIVVGAFIMIRRRNTAKNRNYSAVQTTQPAYYQQPHPQTLVPVTSTSYIPPSAVNRPIPIVDFVLIPSLNLAKFDDISETSALDDVDSLQDQIHRFASTIFAMFPTAVFVPKALKSSPGIDARAANVSGLKRIFAKALNENVFGYFTDAYPQHLGGILFHQKILETHRDRCKVDDKGIMQVEPETVYYAALKLIDRKPPRFDALPDRRVLEIANECKIVILENIAKERVVQIDEKIQKAVGDIVAAAILVVIKLKAIDASYAAYIPGSRVLFDEHRMRSNGSGRTVVFAESCGWEKKRAEGNIVKIPASVWVQ
ncbi:hypothetical protein HK098_002692 [Nowakowskiella sp. JEL0407]|nr:hypothetical protein HK098_002692 [Nowakowskiella sp. JEL0407]